MKFIIGDIDYNKKIIYLYLNGRKTAFYMTNKVAKTFMVYLKKGILVDFEVSARHKKFGQVKAQQILFFNKIVQLNPHKVFYDINLLRGDIKKIFKKNKNYLFMDFEMTMPPYYSDFFVAEIIQAGYLVSKPYEDPIVTESVYIEAKHQKILSKRTVKFLKIDQESYDAHKIPFVEFYERLKNIMTTYKPKIIVWGTNDIKALDEMYQLHHLKPITKRTDFIDLLKVHKNYFNVLNDIGLFKAYETYYQKEAMQTHDALDDAKVTKLVFDAFLMQINQSR